MAEVRRDERLAGIDQRPTIRRRAEELAVVEQCRVLMFALPHGNMTAAEQVERYMTNWNRIIQACRKPGPRIYMVQASRIVLSYPRAQQNAPPA